MDELTPTLEEYARFTGFSLDGPCARVSAGHMCRQFLTFTGLRRAALLPVLSSGHIIPLQFLVDRFSFIDSYARFYDDFAVSEDRWGSLRVDVLMACVISFMYFPAGEDSLDVGVVMAVGALRSGHTILPMILAETYISATYCHSHRGRVFRGSSILLYVWCMSHLRPIGLYRRHGFCFTHSLATQFSFRPQHCTDAASWSAFFLVIEEPFSLVVYSGHCSFMAFLTHVPPWDFIPLAGLRGVTTYHPLAVMGQFDQLQEVHSFVGIADFRFRISLQVESDLLRVYDLWSQRISAEFSDSHPGQTLDYMHWLQGGYEQAGSDQVGMPSSSRLHSSYDSASDTMTSPGFTDMMAPDNAEGTQTRSALIIAEAERDIARVERDAAILARDSAFADRDAIILQTQAVIDAHSDTIRQSTALLARIDTLRQQIISDSEFYDVPTTLSLLLQLIADL